MAIRPTVTAYETPEVLGSFDAQDVLGAADGSFAAGGSSIPA